MSIATIRTALAAVLADVSGVQQASAYPPTSVEPTPSIYLGEAVAEVTMGASEVHTWTIPATIVLGRKADYGQELKIIEGVYSSVLAALRSNYTLAGSTLGLALFSVREGVVTYGGTEYVAMTLAMVVKQKESVTLSG